MTIAHGEVLDILCTLANEEKMNVAVKESVKGGVIAGGAAIVGGLMFGPIGLALGGTVGGCMAAYLAHGKYISVMEVLATMRPDVQAELVERVRKVMQEVDIQDAVKLALMLSGNVAVRRQVIDVLMDFLKSEMQLQIVD